MLELGRKKAKNESGCVSDEAPDCPPCYNDIDHTD